MTAENIFFNILKASLWGTSIEVPADFNDWKGVLRLAKEQTVLALVANTILSDMELAARIPVELKNKLKSFVLDNVRIHAELNNTIALIVTHLKTYEITPVLLKGQGVARNYPIPELRQCGDIDLYVGTQNYLKTCEILSEISSWTSDRNPENTTKHYDVKIGNVLIEIHKYSDVHVSKHYDLIYQRYSDEGLTSGLRPMDFTGITVYLPDDTFNAFFIFNHLWSHYIDCGVGLRHFCDWMMFLHNHKNTIDFYKLRKIIDEMDLIAPWQTMGVILVDYLGLSENEFPFYDKVFAAKASRVIKHVLKEGNFGHNRALLKARSGKTYMALKFQSLFAHIQHSAQLFFLFPSHIASHFLNTLCRGIVETCKYILKPFIK